MGYPDGKYYGFGHAYCVTTNLLQGDIIRVQSVTVPTRRYNATVQTVGEIIHFNMIEPYDRYKISHIQEVEVGGVTTEVELSAVYRDFSYGSTYYIDLFNKTTLAGIKGICNAHAENDLISVGDGLTIKVGGVDWDMKVGIINPYDSHSVILVSDEIWVKSAMSTSATPQSYLGLDTLQTVLQSFYNSMTDEDKSFVATVQREAHTATSSDTYNAKIFLLGNKEVGGNRFDFGWGVQFPLFTTQSQRVRTYNGVADNWFTDDCYGTVNGVSAMRIVTSDGGDAFNGWAWQNTAPSNAYGIVPCFEIKADS